MKPSKAFNGQRLKTARLFRGMTVADLAAQMELNRQTVSQYESGQISDPGYLRIQDMSRILNFPFDFFMSTDTDSIKIHQATYFRSLLTTNKKYRAEQKMKIRFTAILFAYLSEYISFPSLNLPRIRETDDVEDIAAELRNTWKLGTGPIDNLIYHAEQNGIIVSSFSSNYSDIDAFSEKLTTADGERYVIAYSNNKTSAVRIHFDVAHELGHILLHDWEDEIEEISSEDFKGREQQANEFAAALLLPREPFIRDIGNYADKLPYYIELKKKWKVSIAAMIMRARKLELISYERYQLMMRQMQKQGIRKVEPLDGVLATSLPSVLKTAVHMLLDEKILTPRDIIEELTDEYGLALYAEQIEELLSLEPGTLRTQDAPLHFDLEFRR